MRSVKLLADAVGPSAGVADRWYVSDGAKAVGPVGLELIARGIEAGKVPLGSYVRHEAWKVWRPITDLAVVSVDSAAPTPPYHPRPRETMPSTSDDVTLPGRPVFPDEIIPSDALAGAADLDDGLHLLLNAAVLRANADAALVHVVRPDGAVVLYAHGPFARTIIGERTTLLDPVMAAAAEASTVVAEPSPGPAGQALVERLLNVGIACETACMIPVVVLGRLAATLELGRKAPRLRASEIAAIEDLVEALVARAEADHWSF
jgi:hypothetical protein